MANEHDCRANLLLYLKARIPIVVLNTNERRRAVEMLRSVAAELQTSFLVHTLSQGLRELESSRPVSEERSLIGALDAVGQQFQTRANLTAIFTDVQDLTDDTPTARQFYDVASVGEHLGGSLVVITTQPVWGTLQRLGMSITLDAPDEDEMREIIRAFLDEYRGLRDYEIEWDEADLAHAASILAGVSKIEAENVVATLVASGAVRKDDFPTLIQAKDRIFSNISGIERVPVNHSMQEVGGLQGLRSWLDKESGFATGDTRELRERGMRPPRGILLVGVPGCGKSMSAKAIAAAWQLPLYRLDLASVFGQYVGQSETRMKEALASADHVAPCVLWLDEIEKALAGAGSESTGITTRLVGQFLFWLQESTSRVFVVATANDVSRLPPELLRKGRFDELFFVDLPTPEDRREIIQIYLRKYLPGTPTSPELVDRLCDLSEGFCGADLEAACRDIGKQELRSGLPPTDEFAEACFANVTPLSRTNPERIEEIREWGRERAVPAGRVAEHETRSSTGAGYRVVLS